MKSIITLNVNGEVHQIAVNPWRTLLDVLRDDLRLTGTKRACVQGACGVCTVIMDGNAILSCLTLAMDCEGHSITTIESLASSEGLHTLQQSFIDNGALQCGFCTPGVIMTAKALLDENPNPDDTAIKEALAGTYCRCTGHIKTVEAVKKAARPDKEGK